MCSEKLTDCQRIELRIEALLELAVRDGLSEESRRAIARRLDKLMAQWRTMLGDA